MPAHKVDTNRQKNSTLQLHGDAEPKLNGGY